MEIEIAAIITIAAKLGLLEKLLDRRISRAALDTVTPTLPLLDKVYRLGEYKRLTANLAVMEHRIRCALGDEETDSIGHAAVGKAGAELSCGKVKASVERARRVLEGLGIGQKEMDEYKQLPLYRAECRRLERIGRKREQAKGDEIIAICGGAEHALRRAYGTERA